MSKPWIKLHCPKCERYLGEVKEGTECYCATCRKWVLCKREDEGQCQKGSSTTKGN
jgi:hypothetical protein